MRFFTLINLLLLSTILFSQIQNTDTVKFKLLLEKNNPMVGANIFVKNSRLKYGAISDLNGEAELVFTGEKPVIELSFMGPQVTFKLTNPVDSVFLNLETKKAIYYYRKKRMKKIKVNVSGY